jgi:hypothetical protein
MTDYTKLRELIAAAPKWPDVKAVAEDGGTGYSCPLCDGEGSVDAAYVEDRRSDIWAGGYLFYGFGDEHLKLDALVREMIATVPDLLDEHETLRKERDGLRALADEAIDLLCDCAGQFLMEDENGNLRHSFMSTEEALCDFLVRQGLLMQISRGVFRFVRPENTDASGFRDIP